MRSSTNESGWVIVILIHGLFVIGAFAKTNLCETSFAQSDKTPKATNAVTKYGALLTWLQMLA
ncbi:MAG: hypothetical protein WBN06_12725 [Lysobacterales bacterium]